MRSTPSDTIRRSANTRQQTRSLPASLSMQSPPPADEPSPNRKPTDTLDLSSSNPKENSSVGLWKGVLMGMGALCSIGLAPSAAEAQVREAPTEIASDRSTADQACTLYTYLDTGADMRYGFEAIMLQENTVEALQLTDPTILTIVEHGLEQGNNKQSKNTRFDENVIKSLLVTELDASCPTLK